MENIVISHPDNKYALTLKKKFTNFFGHRNLNIPISIWNKDSNAKYLITWKPNTEIFKMPNLKVIFALGAGIDSFLNNKLNISSSIKIVRLEEAGMGKQMLEFALYGILHYSRYFDTFRNAQENQKWLGESTPKRLPFSTKVGIMGLGKLGGFVAKELAKIGYPVSGYSFSKKNINNINCYGTNELDYFLANSEVLINLLPLTENTKNILNLSLFKKIPKSSYLINLARGGHLKEEDLIKAMDLGYLKGALLDVFKIEPLPKNHPFWYDSRIIVTPHLAAITLQEQAIEQITNNIINYENNNSMTGLINREKGY